MNAPLVSRPIPARGYAVSRKCLASILRVPDTGDGPGSEGRAVTQHQQDTSTDLRNELLRGADMARGQQPPIAEMLHTRIDTFFKRFYEMTADGEICELEQEEALDELDAIVMKAEYMAESQAAGLAMVRRGFNSTRATELVGRMRRKARQVA